MRSETYERYSRYCTWDLPPVLELIEDHPNLIDYMYYDCLSILDGTRLYDYPIDESKRVYKKGDMDCDSNAKLNDLGLGKLIRPSNKPHQKAAYYSPEETVLVVGHKPDEHWLTVLDLTERLIIFYMNRSYLRRFPGKGHVYKLVGD